MLFPTINLALLILGFGWPMHQPAAVYNLQPTAADIAKAKITSHERFTWWIVDRTGNGADPNNASTCQGL
jgi:hypothetical protein